MFNECLYIWYQTRLNLTSNFLDQYNPRTKYESHLSSVQFDSSVGLYK